MTYEHVAITIKTTGPDSLMHYPVEVGWWNLATGDRDVFIPPHDPHQALGAKCDFDTINALGYTTRLAQAPQDTDGRHAARLAAALHGAIIVTVTPAADDRLLRRMFDHYYLTNFDIAQRMTMPRWHGILDAGAYAAGVLGLPTVPDLTELCRSTGIPLEAIRTAETDTDALGRAILRLSELVHGGRHRRQHGIATAPAAPELAAAFAAQIDRADYDLIDCPDPDTCKVNGRLVAQMADEIYGPALAALRRQNDDSNRQVTEMADRTNALANRYQKTLAELRTLPLEPDQHAVIKAAVDTAADGEAAANAVGEIVRAWIAALQSTIHDLYEQVHKLDQELADVQASRQAWAIDAMDTELSTTTPWNELVLPQTELSVGPDTAEPTAERPGQVVDLPDHLVAAFLNQEMFPPDPGTRYYPDYDHQPLKICPNPQACDHPLMAHDYETEHDPLPTCGARDGDTDCRCGHPPVGWRRVAPMQVYQPGDTVPPRTTVLGTDGQMSVTNDDPWVLDTTVPVVEIELRPVRGGDPAATDEVPEDAEVAS